MAFGKFVAIMIGDRPVEPAAPAGKGQDRQLDEGKAVDHEVEQADLVRMNDIFGVVEQDSLER